MILILLIISVVIIILLFRYILGLPKIHKVTQSQLKKFIEVLLYRGFDSSFMIIEGSKNSVFLQFKKYHSKNLTCEFRAMQIFPGDSMSDEPRQPAMANSIPPCWSA